MKAYASVKYTYTEFRRYYFKLWWQDWGHYLRRQWYWLPIATLLMSGAYISGRSQWFSNPDIPMFLWYMGIACGLILVFKLVYMCYQYLSYERYFQVDQAGIEDDKLEYEVHFDEQEVRWQEEHKTIILAWPYYLHYKLLDEALYLFDKEESPDIVPLRFIKQGREELLAFIADRLEPYKGDWEK